MCQNYIINGPASATTDPFAKDASAGMFFYVLMQYCEEMACTA